MRAIVASLGVVLMLVAVTAVAQAKTKRTEGGPWVMWKGTPYAHIMVPTTSMVTSASKATAGAKK